MIRNTKSKSRRLQAIEKGPSRRTFLIGSAALASAASWPLILTPGRAKAAASEIFVASYGGRYGEALQEVFFKVFTKETGTNVVLTAAADMAKLKAQVLTGKHEWDMMEMLPTQVVTAADEGLLEPMDYSVIDMSDLIFPEAKKEYWVSAYTYTSSIGYDSQRHPDGKHPTTWPEFWDAEKFPGRRGLRKRPNDNLEIAILATGAKPEEVYPIDVEKAFKSLDAVKPHITHWIKTTPQTVSMISQNEVDFTNTYSGRVYGAQQDGLPLAYTWDQLLVYLNTYAVPKDAKNGKLGMELLNVMMRPELQAEFCNVMTYSPVKWKGLELVNQDIRDNWIPDFKNPANLTVNPEWWGKPGLLDEISNRFNEWLIT